MMSNIAESDWKVFRRLHEVALERFCKRVIDEINQATENSAGRYHERYLEVFKIITDRNEEMARAFDDMRRSTAVFQLAIIRRSDLLTDAEFSQFSPETREAVELILGICR